MEPAKEELTVQIPRKTLEDLITALSHFQPDNKLDRTSIFTTTLDDFVHLNSLLLISLLIISFTFNSANRHHGLEPPSCETDTTFERRLIAYEFSSFVFLLFSILSAKSFKVQLNFSRRIGAVENNYDTDFRRGGLMLMCAATSCVGIGLMMVSLSSRVQVVIGRIHCGSEESFVIVVLIYVVIVAALVIYLFPLARAIRESTKLLDGE